MNDREDNGNVENVVEHKIRTREREEVEATTTENVENRAEPEDEGRE